VEAGRRFDSGGIFLEIGGDAEEGERSEKLGTFF
jgi:hypothetical protein